MGLETSTFIGGLTATWPLAGDKKNVGDDHIRLIKAVLQGTFPTATKAFYFPTAEVIATNITLDATDQNNTVIVDTTGGSTTATLPTLAGADKGFELRIMKGSPDANAIIVSPPSGTIASKVGVTASIRVGQYHEPATFYWSGAAWYCWKPGPSIGSTETYNTSGTPPGYLDENGAAYNTTNFAELFAVLASSVVADKRGRSDIGSGTGSGLTARVVGGLYGAETVILGAGEMPAHNHTIIDNGHQHFAAAGAGSFAGNTTGGFSSGGNAALINTVALNTLSGSINTTGIGINNSGGGGAHANLHPVIGTHKIIRAC